MTICFYGEKGRRKEKNAFFNFIFIGYICLLNLNHCLNKRIEDIESYRTSYPCEFRSRILQCDSIKIEEEEFEIIS
jgi:hypothetical protein